MAKIGVRIAKVDTSRLRRRFKAMARRSNNFKPVFRWMMQQLQEAHRENFRTEGASSGFRWQPLDPQYASWKLENYGAQGILARTGDLRDSLTMNSARGAVRDIGMRTAYFGTTIGYAKFHQAGTANMAERKVLFVPQLMAHDVAKATGEHIVHGSVGQMYSFLNRGFKR